MSEDVLRLKVAALIDDLRDDADDLSEIEFSDMSSGSMAEKLYAYANQLESMIASPPPMNKVPRKETQSHTATTVKR